MGNFKTGDEISRILRRERRIREGVQPVLESGVDVKTINGETIVGPGNLDVAGGGGGVTDHGGLTGLGDDDHTQYLNQARGDARYSQLGHTHPAPTQYGYVGASFDGGGADISAGAQTDLYVPFALTIEKVSLLADAAGSIVIDIWKDSYGNFPPTSADKITASAPPTLSSASKMQDSTLTGWTKTIVAGSTLRFNINSCSGIKRATLLIEGVKG